MEQSATLDGAHPSGEKLLPELPIEDFDDLEVGECSCGESLRIKDIIALG
jgi:hypothetical protein